MNATWTVWCILGAQTFGTTAIILMLTWLCYFRDGMNINSTRGERITDITSATMYAVRAEKIFNVHAFLMSFGFIFMFGQALMAYKTVRVGKKVGKFVHGTLHLISIGLGIIGICAIFEFHREIHAPDLYNYPVYRYHRGVHAPDMYSLHSWIGIGTFILYGFQWFIAFFTFGYPGAPETTRAQVKQWHVVTGRILFNMAIITAETGLIEKTIFLGLQHDNESRVVNFAGVFILFFGIAVNFLLASGGKK